MTTDARKIDWNALEWQEAMTGLVVKEVVRGAQLLRLVRFDATHDRTHWCHKAHDGVVMSGRLTLMFDSGPVEFTAGDALHIEGGPDHRHQTHMAEGETATLFLVEDAPQ